MIPPVAVVQTEEARSEDSPALRLDTLEVVPANAEPAKVATVAETVKQVAIEAIRTSNEESVAVAQNQVDAAVVPEQKSIEAVDAVALKTIPDVVAPVVEVAQPEVKSAAPVEEVRNIVADVVPAETVVKAVENTETLAKSIPIPAPVPSDVVAETVEADHIVPAAIIKEDVPAVAEGSVAVKQLDEVARPVAVDQVKSESVAETAEPVQQTVEQQVKTVEGTDAEKDANLRQSPPSFQSIAQGFINAIGNFIPPLANQQAQQAQQSTQDATSSAETSAQPAPAQESLATGEVAPNGAGSSTAQPNIIQSAWNSITNILQRPTTAAPASAAAAAAAATSDTRKDDATVEVVQNIEVENVNEKLDFNKKATV